MELGRRIASRLAGATFERVAGIGLANAELNQPRIGQSVLGLRDLDLGTGDAAIVIGAGPSLHRRRSLARMRLAGFGGTIIAADGALGACLRAGVVPHVVVTLDPHPERIVRWFGDPTLAAPTADDYFRRQEMDPAHAADEVEANRALVTLVDQHGPQIRAAIATSASPAVVDRCESAGMKLYWWNAMFDDYSQPESVSRRLHRANGLPCLNGGGNVGTTAWVLAHAVLRKRRIGLIGLDLSYPADLPFARTQYAPELQELLGARWTEAFIELESAPTGEHWYCDPAYYWFREIFLEMALAADCQTVNCTEGGVVYGPGITTMPLEEFLHG